MPRRPKLALGPEDGKGFNGLTYKRTLREPAAAVVKTPSPRAERSNSISVQDLLLRRHPLGPRVRDVSRCVVILPHLSVRPVLWRQLRSRCGRRVASRFLLLLAAAAANMRSSAVATVADAAS